MQTRLSQGERARRRSHRLTDEDGRHGRLEERDGEAEQEEGGVADDPGGVVAHIIVQHRQHDGKGDVRNDPQLCGYLRGRTRVPVVSLHPQLLCSLQSCLLTMTTDRMKMTGHLLWMPRPPARARRTMSCFGCACKLEARGMPMYISSKGGSSKWRQCN